MIRSAVIFVALSAAALASNVLGGENDEQAIYREVHTILTAHCSKCHGPEKQENGLRLDHGAAILRGGDSGTAVVAGKSSESLLIQAVMGTSDSVSRMPLKAEPLAENQISASAPLDRRGRDSASRSSDRSEEDPPLGLSAGG